MTTSWEKPDEDRVEDAHEADALQVQREESQGVELFEDPDASLPAATLAEGSPGHEALTGDAIAAEPDSEHPAPKNGDEG